MRKKGKSRFSIQLASGLSRAWPRVALPGAISFICHYHSALRHYGDPYTRSRAFFFFCLPWIFSSRRRTGSPLLSLTQAFVSEHQRNADNYTVDESQNVNSRDISVHITTVYRSRSCASPLQLHCLSFQHDNIVCEFSSRVELPTDPQPRFFQCSSPRSFFKSTEALLDRPQADGYCSDSFLDLGLILRDHSAVGSTPLVRMPSKKRNL